KATTPFFTTTPISFGLTRASHFNSANTSAWICSSVLASIATAIFSSPFVLARSSPCFYGRQKCFGTRSLRHDPVRQAPRCGRQFVQPLHDQDRHLGFAPFQHARHHFPVQRLLATIQHH